MTSKTVAGESAGLLRAAFAKLKRRKERDGMVELSGKLDQELGDPLLRAVLRIEKELLDQDVANGDPDLGTTSQRRADAFVLLAERLKAAIERS